MKTLVALLVVLLSTLSLTGAPLAQSIEALVIESDCVVVGTPTSHFERGNDDWSVEVAVEEFLKVPVNFTKSATFSCTLGYSSQPVLDTLRDKKRMIFFRRATILGNAEVRTVAVPLDPATLGLAVDRHQYFLATAGEVIALARAWSASMVNSTATVPITNEVLANALKSLSNASELAVPADDETYRVILSELKAGNRLLAARNLGKFQGPEPVEKLKELTADSEESPVGGGGILYAYAYPVRRKALKSLKLRGVNLAVETQRLPTNEERLRYRHDYWTRQFTRALGQDPAWKVAEIVDAETREGATPEKAPETAMWIRVVGSADPQAPSFQLLLIPEWKETAGYDFEKLRYLGKVTKSLRLFVPADLPEPLVQSLLQSRLVVPPEDAGSVAP